MFLYAIGVVCELANHSDPYRVGWRQLLSQKPVQAVLAHVFFTQKIENKALIFQISRVHGFPVKEVPQIMDANQPQNKQQGQQTFDSLFARLEQIDQLIARLTHAASSTHLMNVDTSEVIELYEYKLASLRHGERGAQANLEAATQHAVHLQHREALGSAELSRLYQLLFHKQQQQQEAERQLKSCQDLMQTVSARLTREQEQTARQLKRMNQTLIDMTRCLLIESKVLPF